MVIHINTNMKKYFVYAYLDPCVNYNQSFDDCIFSFEPFYIGYGSNTRHIDHLKTVMNGGIDGSNPFKSRKIKKILNKGFFPIVIKLKDELTLEEAKNLETYLIKTIGTRSTIENHQHGPLTNLREGGNGGLSDYAKKKLSKSKMGQTLSDETKSKVSVKTKEALQDPERRAKISATHLGKAKTTDHANKLREHLANKCNTPEQRKRTSERMKNRVISQHERDRIAKGVSEFNKNTVIINDGVINKRIKMDVLELFISQGWVRGRIKKVST